MTIEGSSEVKAMNLQTTRRSVLLGAGFALTAGLAAAVTPRRHEATIGAARLETLIPDAVGPWSAVKGGSLILPETQQPNNFYDQVLTRTYLAPNLPEIMLLIAYGEAQSGMMKVHRPEVCYASAGFSIRDFEHTDVPINASQVVPATRFLGRREDRSEQVLYWTRISNVFPHDLTAQRMVVFERGLTGVIPDGVLVRFSTLDVDPKSSVSAMKNFAARLIAGANPKERSLLIGSAKPSATV